MTPARKLKQQQLAGPLECEPRDHIVNREFCARCWVDAHSFRQKKSPGWDCPSGHRRRAASLGLPPTKEAVEIIRGVGTFLGAPQQNAIDKLHRELRHAAGA